MSIIQQFIFTYIMLVAHTYVHTCIFLLYLQHISIQVLYVIYTVQYHMYSQSIILHIYVFVHNVFFCICMLARSLETKGRGDYGHFFVSRCNV